MFGVVSISKLQEVESKNQDLLAEIDRLKKETEELRLRRGPKNNRHVFCLTFASALCVLMSDHEASRGGLSPQKRGETTIGEGG